ncbi:hypothetical protein [[Eubacterium] cellulosolvens]
MAVRQCALCDRTEKTHRISVEAGLCNPCEVALSYWRNKTPTQLVKRARQIDSFQNRMELLMGNVKRMPKRRRA